MAITRANLAKLVDKAIQQTGDLRTTITLRRVTPGVYNPTTDTTSDVTSDTVVENVILTSLSKAEYGWFPADRNTQKILLPSLAVAGITPDEADKVLINGETWEIVRIKTPPGDSLYILYVERS